MIYHHCQSKEKEGNLTPLQLHPKKEPYRPSILDYKAFIGRMADKPKIISHWYCPYCSCHVMTID